MLRIRRLLGNPTRRTASGPLAGLFLLLSASAAMVAWQAQPVPRPSAPATPVLRLAQTVAEPQSGQVPAPAIQETERAPRTQLAQAAPQPRAGQAPAPIVPQTERERRYAEADQRFAKGDVPGSQTYRGAIYITLGEPESTEPVPSGERWFYSNVDGGPMIIEFLESDRRGFRVRPDPAGGPILVQFMAGLGPENATLGSGVQAFMERFLKTTVEFREASARAR